MSTYNHKNECKLMILYLLKSLDFPLNHECLSNFFLDKYASYIVFQGILAELVDNKLIEEHKTKTSVFYNATNDGIEALNSFIDDVPKNYRDEMDKYIKDNKLKLKEESIIKADYTDSVNGNFKLNLEINDSEEGAFKLEIDVPSIEAASTMCENWKAKAKNIYSYVIKQLL